MASILAFVSLFIARGQAFQSAPLHINVLSNHHHTATRLSAQPPNPRKSETRAYYASTADPPLTEKPTVKSFGSRMRKLVLREQQAERQKRASKAKVGKRSTINPAKPPFVEEAVSLSTYKELVADEHEKVVVVRFYAKWCRACKAVEPYFYRLARSMPDVKFVEVPVLEQNANLHQGLGVPALPFAHIYSPTAGLVEELRMAKKDFKNFQSVVKTYQEGRCSELELDSDSGMFLSPFSSSDDGKTKKGPTSS